MDSVLLRYGNIVTEKIFVLCWCYFLRVIDKKTYPLFLYYHKISASITYTNTFLLLLFGEFYLFNYSLIDFIL